MAEEVNSSPQAVLAEAQQSLDAKAEANDAEDSSEEESGASEEELAAAEKVAAPKEIKKQLRKLKLKVDGKEYDEEFDPNDDVYMTKQLQLAKASQKRMQQYSDLERDVKSFIDELRKDPRKVLSDPTIGIDIKQLAAQVIQDEIENSQKSPEQIKQEKLENELRELKAEREKEKEDGKARDLERLQHQEYERYDMLMTQTLEKSDLPKSPYVVKKIADYMLLGLEQGHDVTPEDVLPLVRDEIQADLKEMFAVMPDEVIESIIGKEVFNRMRKKNIAKAKGAPAAPVSTIKDTGKSSKADEKKSGQKQSFKSFFGV